MNWPRTHLVPDATTVGSKELKAFENKAARIR
jgi:hypothetical protein